MAVPIPSDDVPEVVADEPVPASPPPVDTEVAAHQDTFGHPDDLEEDEDLEPAHHPAGARPVQGASQLSVAAPMSSQIRRHDRILTAAWAASFAVLAALGVAGYTKRETLMREWPASKRVYATLGLAPVDNTSREGEDPNRTR